MKRIIILLVFMLTLSGCSVFNNAPDSYTSSIPTESNGAVPVNIQDQTTPPVDFFFTQIQAPPTTLNESTEIDDMNVTVLNTTGCSVDSYFGLFNADNADNNRAYFGTIQAINGNVFTLDTPLDFNFSIGDTAACFNRSLNVDGSVTNQIFSVQIGSAATQSIDITRIMVSLLTDDPVSLALFGDLPELTNGIVLRRVDGMTHNIWNVKSNGELANLCFDYDPQLATNPSQGQNGAKFRYTFAGQDKHGVAVRLDPGDELQLIIQDDLSGLQQFRIIAEGHYVTD